MVGIVTKAILTCPKCGAKHQEEMPTDACQHVYECSSCKTLLRPTKGKCCVYCSYADTKCPPEQKELAEKKT